MSGMFFGFGDDIGRLCIGLGYLLQVAFGALGYSVVSDEIAYECSQCERGYPYTEWGYHMIWCKMQIVELFVYVQEHIHHDDSYLSLEIKLIATGCRYG
jgi:hypothetical protein